MVEQSRDEGSYSRRVAKDIEESNVQSS